MIKPNTLEMVQQSCLMDDIFMSECLRQNECVELVLSIILERDIKVENVQTQEFMRSWGRSVKLDIAAFENANASANKRQTRYNIEVQRKNEGSDIRRARYHTSIMDTYNLLAGQDFKALGDNCVIFITERDVFNRGRPRYTIERRFKETNEPAEDGTQIIYVNGSIRDVNTPLGKLTHDFFCINPDEFCYPILADRVRYFKESKIGSERMEGIYERFFSKYHDEIRAECLAEGEEIGRTKERQSLLKDLLARGMITLEAAKSMGLA